MTRFIELQGKENRYRVSIESLIARWIVLVNYNLFAGSEINDEDWQKACMPLHAKNVLDQKIRFYSAETLCRLLGAGKDWQPLLDDGLFHGNDSVFKVESGSMVSLQPKVFTIWQGLSASERGRLLEDADARSFAVMLGGGLSQD